MGKKLMGFEGKAYYGAKGATAGTELTNSRDIKLRVATEKGETSVRGTTGPVKKSSRVTAIDMDGIEIAFAVDETDASAEAMRVAAATGDPIALRLKDKANGKGFDGDVIVEYSHEKPYKGEQVQVFTLTPNNDLREWNPYV